MNRTAVLSSPWPLCRRQSVGRHRLRQCYHRITAGNRKEGASIYLKLDEPSIAGRIGQDTPHDISASLLHSQAETSENAVVVPLHGSVAKTVIDLRNKPAVGQRQRRAVAVQRAAVFPFAGRTG
jgi:hypothetical protein